MKNVLYYDTDSEVIKLLQHVAFDEAMNDVDEPSPNACLLHDLDPDTPDVLDLTLSVPNLDVSAQPFTDLGHMLFPLTLIPCLLWVCTLICVLGFTMPIFAVSVVCLQVSIFVPSVIDMLGLMWCYLVAHLFSLWPTSRLLLIVCLP